MSAASHVTPTEDNAWRQFQAQADHLLGIGRPGSALAVAMDCVAAAPDRPEPWCLVARAHLGLNQLVEALDAADEAIKLDPGGEYAQRVRAWVLSYLDRHDEAVAAAREAIRLAPDEPLTYLTLGRVQWRGAPMAEAWATAQKLLVLAPEAASSHHLAGEIALAQSRWSEAETHLRHAVRLDPTNWEPICDLGVAVMNQHRLEEAIELFHRANRANPSVSLPREKLADATKRYSWAGELPWMWPFVLLIILAVVGNLSGSTVLLCIGVAIPPLVLTWFLWDYRRRKRRIIEIDPLIPIVAREAKPSYIIQRRVTRALRAFRRRLMAWLRQPW